MKRFGFLAFLLLAVGSAFVAGSWYGHKSPGSAGPPVRKVLYYVDPMHPSYRSDQPGIAPDCGMQLEPVYEDGGPSAGDGGAPRPAGTVAVTPVQQQVLGVRVAAVEKSAVTHKVRVLGKVAADERRTYVVNAPVDGWVQNTLHNSTGSLVRKDEVLAHFYSPELGALVRSLMFSLGTRERSLSPGEKFPFRADLSLDTVAGLRNQRDAQQLDILRNLGLGERQIEELVEKRQWTGNVEITAPGDGFILYRNVSEGVRLTKGAEMFRIADLRKVWILADVYGEEVKHFRPGMPVRGTIPELDKTFVARVTDILPQFDAVTRTMKVRLEADNPGFLLRQDMFVDLEVAVRRPPALNVVADAVLDAGTRKTVFVDRGNGVFEPREVETGWRTGNRVEIVRGLSAGERIVVSGNFLVDSESRMKKAAAGIYGVSHIDPVCGMEVDERRAKAGGKTFDYQGKVYYLCSDECLDRLRKEPARVLRPPDGMPGVRAASMSHGEHGGHAMPHGSRRSVPGVVPDAPQVKSPVPEPSAPAGEDPKPSRPQALRRGLRIETPSVAQGAPLAPMPSTAMRGQEMRATAPVPKEIVPDISIDPVCLMPVGAVKAKAEGRTFEHNDTTYYLCSDECLEKFRKEPSRYITLPDAGKKPASASPMPPGGHGAHGMPGEGLNAMPAPPVPPQTTVGMPPPPAPPGAVPAGPARTPVVRRRNPAERPKTADGIGIQVEHVDPVCGKPVSAGRVSLYRGKTYYFCDDSCKRRFDKNPEEFLREASAPDPQGDAEKNHGGPR